MKKTAGLSLIEMLIAMSLLSIVLTALSSTLIGSRKAYQAQENLSEKQQTVTAALSLLSYELSLAGYRGNNLTELENRTFDSSTFYIKSGDLSDELTIHYYEDRWTEDGSTVLRKVHFAARNTTLYRTELSNSEEAFAILEGIQAIKVTDYLTRDGVKLPVQPELDNLTGIILSITYQDGSSDQLSIAFPNQQTDS